MRKVVFDIETKNSFADVGTRDPNGLDISIVGLYDFETDQYLTFEQHEFPSMWRYFEMADVLISFNGDHFDIPILNKYYPGDISKLYSLDILREMQKSYGRRMKLDQIAEGTLHTHKSADGMLAIEWWRAGEKQKVKDYCLKDVKITKEVYEYARKNNRLIFAQGGQLIEVPLAAHTWEEAKPQQAMTYSLPF